MLNFCLSERQSLVIARVSGYIRVFESLLLRQKVQKPKVSKLSVFALFSVLSRTFYIFELCTFSAQISLEMYYLHDKMLNGLLKPGKRTFAAGPRP